MIWQANVNSIPYIDPINGPPKRPVPDSNQQVGVSCSSACIAVAFPEKLKIHIKL